MLPCLKGDTFSKPSFLVSMLIFSSVDLEGKLFQKKTALIGVVASWVATAKWEASILGVIIPILGLNQLTSK